MATSIIKHKIRIIIIRINCMDIHECVCVCVCVRETHSVNVHVCARVLVKSVRELPILNEN